MHPTWSDIPGTPRSLVLAYDAMRLLIDDPTLRQQWAERVVDHLVDRVAQIGPGGVRLTEDEVRELAERWAGRRIPQIQVAVEAGVRAAAAQMHDALHAAVY